MFNQLIPTDISKLRQLSALAGPETINMTIGNPIDHFPPELDYLISQELTIPLSYTSNSGHHLLRESIAQKFDLQARSLVITAGAQGGLACTLMAILNPNDKVLIPDPGFLAYPTLVKMFGAQVESYSYHWSEGQFKLSVEDLIQQIPEHTKCLIINNPSNPCGHKFNHQELIKLSHWAAEKGVYIILDEVYGELNYTEDYQPSLYLNDYTISIGSLSKSHALTGLRIGWVAATNEELIKRLTVVNQYQSTCTSSISQAIAYELFRNQELYQQILNKYRSLYQQKMELFFAGINHLINPQCCFYAFCEIPDGVSSEEFAKEFLQEHKILVVPGSYFGQGGDQFIRLSLSTGDENILKTKQAYLSYFS